MSGAKWRAKASEGARGPDTRFEVLDEDGDVIARLSSGDVEETRANAALIAAAPELYDALHEMMAAHLRADPHTPEQCANCEKACAALAKAKGGAL